MMSFSVLACTTIGLLWTIFGSCLASSNVKHFKYRRALNTADMCLEKTLPPVSLLRCAANCARLSCRSFVYKLEGHKCTPNEGTTKQRCSMAAAPIWKLLTKKPTEKPESASNKATATKGKRKAGKKPKSTKISKKQNKKAGPGSKKASTKRANRKATKKPKRGMTINQQIHQAETAFVNLFARKPTAGRRNQQRSREATNSYGSFFTGRRRPTASYTRSSYDDSACPPNPQPVMIPKSQRGMCQRIIYLETKNTSEIHINEDSLPIYLIGFNRDGFLRHQFIMFYSEMLAVQLPRIASRHIKDIVIDYKHNSDGAVYWLTSGGRYDCLYSSALKSYIVERNGSSCLMLEYGEAEAAFTIPSGSIDSFIVDGEDFGLLGKAGYKRVRRMETIDPIIASSGEKIGLTFAVNPRVMFFVRKYHGEFSMHVYGFNHGRLDNRKIRKKTVTSMSVDANGKFIYMCNPKLIRGSWNYRGNQIRKIRCKQVTVRGEVIAIITEKNSIIVLSSNTFKTMTSFKAPKTSSHIEWSLK